jgi:hypothetical protein
MTVLNTIITGLLNTGSHDDVLWYTVLADLLIKIFRNAPMRGIFI